MKEQATVRAILQFLHLHHISAWRMNTGAFRAAYKGTTRFHRFGVKGMSDIIGILPGGKFLAIEVKQPRNQPAPAQRGFLDEVMVMGGEAFVAHSVAEVKERLCL